jgi:hypothetical protein
MRTRIPLPALAPSLLALATVFVLVAFGVV